MQSANITAYFRRLIRDGHRWQYTDVWNTVSKPRFYFTKVQWFIFFSSAITAIFLSEGYPDDFVNYVMTALSIFVGLFLSLVLTAYDKYKAHPKQERLSFKKQDELFTRRNFFKQFIALTAYAIVISLLCIVLLGLVSLSSFFGDCLYNHPIAPINFASLICFIRVFGQTVFNGVIMYFLLDFLTMVLYAVTAIHAFMQVEFDRDEKEDEYVNRTSQGD